MSGVGIIVDSVFNVADKIDCEAKRDLMAKGSRGANAKRTTKKGGPLKTAGCAELDLLQIFKRRFRIWQSAIFGGESRFGTMANFATHFVGGAVLGAAVATGAWITGSLTPLWAACVATTTTFAALFPDLDADNSIPTRWLWDFCAVGAAALVVVLGWGQLQLAVIGFLAVLVAAVVRYGVAYVFMWFTRHRGLFHTIQAALVVGLLCLHLVARCASAPKAALLWISGGAVVGYVFHLVLDECFSVDLGNARLRRSFGTALKIWDRQAILGSLVLTAICSAWIWQSRELLHSAWRYGKLF